MGSNHRAHFHRGCLFALCRPAGPFGPCGSPCWVGDADALLLVPGLYGSVQHGRFLGAAVDTAASPATTPAEHPPVTRQAPTGGEASDAPEEQLHS